MRIYTEVNFQWDDKKGKLVEVSSDSFDYSGEMALCDWTGGSDWWTKNIAGYDHEGNRYTWRRAGDHWQVAVSYRQGGGFGEPKLIHNDASSSQSDAKLAILNNRQETLPKDATGTNILKSAIYTTQEAGLLAYAGGLATAGESVEQIYDRTGYYQKEGAEEGQVEWSTLGADETLPWLLDTDPDDDLDLTGFTQEEQTAISGIKMQIDEWERLTQVADDPLDADSIELLVKGYVSTLKEKERELTTAYEDIWGEGGSIFEIKEDWETAEERGKVKYRTDAATYETERTEGLEETVVGREGELEALREEAGGEIRAAEAKIGSAGFASTGVGRTARDVLAEEIGGEARDIDEGFTEERSDVKQSYLDKLDPLKKEFGTGGTAYEDYIVTRDRDAGEKLEAWKTASTAYEKAEKRYEEIDLPSALAEHNTALRNIGIDIMGYIGDIRGGVVGDPNEQFDPFGTNAPLSDYSAEQFGIELGLDTMYFAGIPDAATAEPFYEPYKVDPGGLHKYDPNKPMPWEDAPGGDPDIPGGQG